MAHVFDEAAGGYRLVCEATGVESDVVATEERAVMGLEWFCPDPVAEEAYLARQRARFKQNLVARGLLAEEAEDEAADLRWDLMPDGRVVGEPSDQAIADAEASMPELVQRARVAISADKASFTADGMDEVTVTFEGLVAEAEADLGDGLTVTVSPTDAIVTLTSDIPRTFEPRVLDANHYSRPITVEAQ